MTVTLRGKKDFADIIKLRILRWGDFSGLSRWDLNAITLKEDFTQSQEDKLTSL